MILKKKKNIALILLALLSIIFSQTQMLFDQITKLIDKEIYSVLSLKSGYI